MRDDIAIVDAWKNGDNEAVQWFIDTYGTRLVRSAYLLCGNEADAQDIVQETLVTALKSCHKFKGKSRLYTWVHGILINVTRHWLRARKIHVPIEDIPERTDECADVREVERRSTHALLVSRIRELPPAQREVIVLRYFNEMTVPEIAAATHTRQGTVKSRLHYALKQLQTLLPADVCPESARSHDAEAIAHMSDALAENELNVVRAERHV